METIEVVPEVVPKKEMLEISFDEAVTGFLRMQGKVIILTRVEMAILCCLNKSDVGRSMKEVSLYVWNEPKHVINYKTFGVHLLNLRRKIKCLGICIVFDKKSKFYYITVNNA